MNNNTTYRVTGMTCGGCERSMRGALERAAPDLKVDVSHQADTVVVHGTHNADVIKQAVDAAGFDFEGLAS